MRAGPKGTITAEPLDFTRWPANRARRRERFITDYLGERGADPGPIANIARAVLDVILA